MIMHNAAGLQRWQSSWPFRINLLSKLLMFFERLYEDNVAGKIDDARFAKMAKRYEQEQGENGKRIKALRLELKQSEGKRMDIDDFLIGAFDVPDRRKVHEEDIIVEKRKGVALSYAPTQIAM